MLLNMSCQTAWDSSLGRTWALDHKKRHLHPCPQDLCQFPLWCKPTPQNIQSPQSNLLACSFVYFVWLIQFFVHHTQGPEPQGPTSTLVNSTAVTQLLHCLSLGNYSGSRDLERKCFHFQINRKICRFHWCKWKKVSDINRKTLKVVSYSSTKRSGYGN